MTASIHIGDFIAFHVPRRSRQRYFVRYGATTKFNRGFTCKRQADEFIDAAERHYGKDWRTGYLFRVRGVDCDIEIVDKRGKQPKCS